MSEILTNDELEKIKNMRIDDFSRGALQAMNWKSMAGRLKRASDVILERFNTAINDSPNLVLYTERQEEQYDRELIETYLFLMGLSIENLATGIVMNIHPEYLKKDKGGVPERLVNIKSHNTYDLLISNKIFDFENYKDILIMLSKYVVWIGRYPVPLELEEMEPKINPDGTIERIEIQPKDIERISSLFKGLYDMLTIESRLRYLKNNGIVDESFISRQLKEITDEIISYMEPVKGPKHSLGEAIGQFGFQPKLAEEALLIYIYYLPEGELKSRLDLKLELYRLGRDDEASIADDD